MLWQALIARKAPYNWKRPCMRCFWVFLPPICFEVLMNCGISLLFRIQYSRNSRILVQTYCGIFKEWSTFTYTRWPVNAKNCKLFQLQYCVIFPFWIAWKATSCEHVNFFLWCMGVFAKLTCFHWPYFQFAIWMELSFAYSSSHKIISKWPSWGVSL